MMKDSRNAMDAVYSGSRNLYPHMVTAAKSLIANSPVGRVWFLIEDEEFPHELPDIISTIDVSGQEWFHPKSANIKTGFTYMSLLRVCYTKLIPSAERILQLDVDTVVVDDISELWRLNMGDAWLAAVREPPRYIGEGDNRRRIDYKPWGEDYFNIGVAVFNLRQIAKDGQDDWLIHVLNTEHMRWIDQDAWNKYHKRRYIDLPTRYNESMVTGYTDNPAIIHFAGYGNAWIDPSDQKHREIPRLEHLRKYSEMEWAEAMERHEKISANR